VPKGRASTTQTSPVRRRGKNEGTRLRFLAVVHSESRPNGEVEWWPVQEAKLVIGREPGKSGISLDDAQASRRHAELEYLEESDVYRLKDLGSRNRTFVDTKPIESEYLQSGAVIRIGGSLLVYSEATLPAGIPPFIPESGNSLARARAEAVADLAAGSPIPILLLGPTGSGKELLAHRIHESSKRSGPLVPVNCATFARELIGSELFGHVQGAFSGATGSRSGLFVAANGGTLFLDEIAELPLDQQPALLRVLQEGKVRPVGSDRETAVDVRVVAATHQRLEQLKSKGAFRPDLYARLAGMPIELPGLVERREEILTLFRRYLGDGAPPITSEAAEALLMYTWPENIRELVHAAERVRLFARNLDGIDLNLLPSEIQKAASDAVPDDEAPTKEQLERLLVEHQGNIAKVSRALGKHRQQLYRWLRRYDLDAIAYRPSDAPPEGPADGD
jgi:transcriptional regulator of acetoin/glycerol metabolism